MILGITGGFGSGKSSVLKFFESRSWFVMDADSVCRSFYETKETELMDCIRKNFGDGVFDKEGFVDRKKLGEILFRSPQKMELITQVIYPMLTKKIHSAVAECRKKGINGAFELPLLYEGGYEKLFDAVLTIWTSPEIRVERLKKRGFTAEDMKKRDAKQLPLELKLEKADFALINDGTEEALCCQLDELLKRELV